jgi:hypothetical protein
VTEEGADSADGSSGVPVLSLYVHRRVWWCCALWCACACVYLSVCARVCTCARLCVRGGACERSGVYVYLCVCGRLSY